MLQYKLLNPSDDIRFDAPNQTVAAFSVILVSEYYAAETADAAEANVPVFAFMPDGYCQEWFDSRGITTNVTMTQDKRDEIATCLESFRYAKTQTSLNNIVALAHHRAAEMRKPVPAPGH